MRGFYFFYIKWRKHVKVIIQFHDHLPTHIVKSANVTFPPVIIFREKKNIPTLLSQIPLNFFHQQKTICRKEGSRKPHVRRNYLFLSHNSQSTTLLMHNFSQKGKYTAFHIFISLWSLTSLVKGMKKTSSRLVSQLAVTTKLLYRPSRPPVLANTDIGLLYKKLREYETCNACINFVGRECTVQLSFPSNFIDSNRYRGEKEREIFAKQCSQSSYVQAQVKWIRIPDHHGFPTENLNYAPIVSLRIPKLLSPDISNKVKKRCKLQKLHKTWRQKSFPCQL